MYHIALKMLMADRGKYIMLVGGAAVWEAWVGRD